MPKSHLNLRDSVIIADFIASAIEFLPENDRQPYEKLLADMEIKDAVPRERVVEMAKNLGIATWPGRRALQQFVNGVGADTEWERLLSDVRPTTATILKRLKKAMDDAPVDAVLASSDAATEINERIEVELDLVRPRVQVDLWRGHQKALQPMIKEATVELEAMRKRLKRLRNQATASKDGLQDELMSKLEQFEDRIYFGGETIPLEMLDEELNYDASELEVPADDGQML